MTKATLMEKAFNWGLAYSFRNLVHYHGGGHGGRHVSEALADSCDQQAAGQERDTVPLQCFENFKAHSQSYTSSKGARHLIL